MTNDDGMTTENDCTSTAVATVPMVVPQVHQGCGKCGGVSHYLTIVWTVRCNCENRFYCPACLIGQISYWKERSEKAESGKDLSDLYEQITRLSESMKTKDESLKEMYRALSSIEMSAKDAARVAW